MNFVSIDFETANEKRDSPCAIGLVVVNGQEIVDEYYSLINPMMYFNPFNTRIHGIREDDVVDAPTFAELWPMLNRFLTNHMVIAHNASFDMSVIRQTLNHFNLPYPEMDYLCTVNISKRVWPELVNHKLDTLASYHGISFEHHHALEDARVAAGILLKVMETYETSDMDVLLEKCHISKGRIYEHGYFPPKVRRKKHSRKLYF